ncbi:MAG: Lrp/AsnC family transcriptional regulator [Geodermatophilaceae bacterium]|nr:Lrp/AsnC family transcriptional regulator [Geodermatophilaceae bacterium]
MQTPRVDKLDARLLLLLEAEPRLGVLECSRRLGAARGTVQARLEQLQRTGVIRGFGPDVDPAALGYAVTAFATMQIRQGRGAAVARRLAVIPEVIEVHTITGDADLIARIVARSNTDLQQVIDEVVADDDIVRTSTSIALSVHIPYRTGPLLQRLLGQDADPPPSR